jgi:hypothetical protein
VPLKISSSPSSPSPAISDSPSSPAVVDVVRRMTFHSPLIFAARTYVVPSPITSSNVTEPSSATTAEAITSPTGAGCPESKIAST